MALSEQAGRRKEQAVRGALGETVGHSVASVGQPGQAGHGPRAAVTDWQPAGRHAGHLRGCAAGGPPRAVYFAVCLCLHWLPGSAGSSSLSQSCLWPGHGLFSLWTLGLWTGSQTWSPGAGFASISVTDSLGPRTLGLSFPICHTTRWTVWQMFFGSKRVSSNDVQCQSPEYKADSSGGPGHTWLKGPPPLALLLPWKVLQFGGWGVPSGPPLASSAGRKATGCVVCCVLTQRTPRCPGLGWSSLSCSRTWTPCDRLARWEKLSTLGVRLPLPTAHPSGRGDSVVTPLPPLWPDPAGHFPHLV